MKMKNLDTEISSLSTEYDTIKNVISKNIEMHKTKNEFLKLVFFIHLQQVVNRYFLVVVQFFGTTLNVV